MNTRTNCTSVFILLLVVFALIAGCATIISKSVYPVTIKSRPEGAEIVITNKQGEQIYSGLTPTTVSLKAHRGFFEGEDYTVEFKKSGYKKHTASINRGVDGWYLGGNILVGGLIGWLIVDPISGAMWTLDDLSVVLLEETTSKNFTEPKLNIVHLKDVPKHLHGKLVPLN